MPDQSNKSRKGFLKQFRNLLDDLESCEDVDLKGSLRLGEKKVRVPVPSLPLQLLLGGESGHRLHLYPELRVNAAGDFSASGDFLLLYPDEFFQGISGFLRIGQGDAVTVGRDDRLHRQLLGLPKLVDGRHLQLKLTSKGLALKNKSSGQGACVAPLTSKDEIERMVQWRREKITRLAKLLGTPIAAVGRSEALDMLECAIAATEREPYREPCRNGRPGGLLNLPDGPRPIFVGDLHACIDNLLVLLTQNGFIEALLDGSGMLILLGDAVHPDVEGEEDQMDTSMLLMDLIFRLKLRFPTQVFYLRGNHDSFSEDISKGGVPQGLLWEKALHDKRGPKYRSAMEQFYDLLPYLAYSKSFVACHAGAPTSKYSRTDLVEIHDNPRLTHQLTHVRLRRPNSPSGYNHSDVSRLRKCLGLDSDALVIVGHTPLSSDETFWPDAGGIENHYVLFGANPDRVGVITRVGRRLLPMYYQSEPILTVINRWLERGGVEEPLN